ncbi:MAG: glycosyltransferase family 2 protein [Oscillospiraceae bacterium]|nr:glycosyltransferase family 2 protein [Oscillospiraceae bacterium]
MSEKPKVSACIVLYKNFEQAREALASIFENTKGCELEMFVVDNASGDGGLEKLAAEFPQIRAIQLEDNRGFGHGHNAVLPLIDSEFHAVINPDIILSSDVLSEIAGYLQENPDIGQVTPKILSPDGEVQVLGKRNPSFLALMGRNIFKKALKPVCDHYAMLDEDLSKPIDIQFATGCFSMIRSDIFKRLGGYDERFFLYFEDMDITRRVNQTSRAVYYPYSSVVHAWDRAYSHKPKYFAIVVASMFKYFAKWGFQLK